MNTSIAWFEQEYEGSDGLPVFIHPGKELAGDAFLNKNAWVLQPQNLETLKQKVHSFYNSFTVISFENLSTTDIMEKLETYQLQEDNLKSRYLERVT